MADLLIRDVPDDVVAAIDAKARRAGLCGTGVRGGRWLVSVATMPAT